MTEKYWPLLVPEYQIGCKRRVFDKAKYIPCLQNDKLQLTADPIVRIGESCVLTRSGRSYPADAIVSPTWYDSVLGCYPD